MPSQDKTSKAAGKRPYRKPRIEDYGTVADLTLTGAGTIDDGGGFGPRSGAAA